MDTQSVGAKIALQRAPKWLSISVRRRRRRLPLVYFDENVFVIFSDLWVNNHTSHNPAYRQQRLSESVCSSPLRRQPTSSYAPPNWMCVSKFAEHFIIFFPRNWSHVLAHIFPRPNICRHSLTKSISRRKETPYNTHNLISILSVRKFFPFVPLKKLRRKTSEHVWLPPWVARTEIHPPPPRTTSSVSRQYFI